MIAVYIHAMQVVCEVLNCLYILFCLFFLKSFVGLCTGLLFGIGLVGATVIAIIVDRTRQFELASKVCFAVSATGLIAFMIVSMLSGVLVLV